MGRQPSEKNKGFKVRMKDQSLFSVITVTFNCVDVLEETILSVINQTYKERELIIIDGGSTDGTLTIVDKYRESIAYFISEPDNGIYDAMNKGIRAAKGSWLNFLNAGDAYVDENVLKTLFSSTEFDDTLVYGDIYIQKLNGEREYRKAIKVEGDAQLKQGMKICHQAIFYHRDIIQFYDASLKLKAEWKHLIETVRYPKFKPKKVKLPIVSYRLGGMGAVLHNLNRREMRQVFKEMYGLPEYIKAYPYFFELKLRSIIKDLLQLLNISY